MSPADPCWLIEDLACRNSWNLLVRAGHQPKKLLIPAPIMLVVCVVQPILRQDANFVQQVQYGHECCSPTSTARIQRVAGLRHAIEEINDPSLQRILGTYD